MIKVLGSIVGVLAAMLIAISIYAWILRADNARLATDNDVLTKDRSALNVDMRACKGANASWQSALDNVQDSLKQCVGARDDVASKAADAVAASRANEAQLNAELSVWRARYRAATQSPDCATVMEARLCPSVLDY